MVSRKAAETSGELQSLLMKIISRRAWLASAAALAGCRRPRGGGYPGLAVVANREGRSVAVVDLTEFTVSRRLALHAAPAEVLAHGERRAAYVLCPEAGEIHEFDAASLRFRHVIRLGGGASGMRLAPDGRSIWVLSQNPHALVRIGLESRRVEGRLRLPAPGGDFDLSGSGVIAVSFPGEGKIGLARLGAATLTMVPAGGGPIAVRFRQDGRLLLAGNRQSRSLTAIDAQTGRVTAHLPLGFEPVHFCFKPDGGELFVSGPGMDAVAIVAPYKTEVTETILAGKTPAAMAASASVTLPYLFVANPATASVTVLDIDSRRLMARVGVGTDPGQILITPDGQYAMTLNRGTGDMAVMHVPALRVETDGKTRRYTAPPLLALIPVGRRPVSAALV